MGLREINNAVFLKANSETIKQLVLVQEYISYGYPTKKTVN
jgi:ribosomal protein L30/L7E